MIILKRPALKQAHKRRIAPLIAMLNLSIYLIMIFFRSEYFSGAALAIF
jgi:hypothetical protein